METVSKASQSQKLKNTSRIFRYLIIISFLISSIVANATITGSTQVCEFETETYFHTGVSNPSSHTYTWSTVGGVLNVNGIDTVSVYWRSVASAYISVVVTDSLGNVVDTDTLNVNFVPRPVPYITSDFETVCTERGNVQTGIIIQNDSSNCFTVCDSSTVTFTTPLNAGSIYEWTVVGADSSSPPYHPAANVVIVKWGAAGIGSVSVTETNNSCSQTAYRCVDIIDRPVAGFTTTPAPTAGTINICRNQTVYFTDASSGAVNYLWDYGDGTRGRSVNPHHTYTTAGTYTVKQEVVNDCGCIDSLTITVVVDADPAPDIHCVSSVCSGNSDTYATSVVCSNYNWSVTGGTITAGQNTNTIVVQWNTATNGQGMVSLDVGTCLGVCTHPNTVIVPILNSPSVISGTNPACQDAIEVYRIPPMPGSIFNWRIRGGEFVVNNDTTIFGPNLNGIRVRWGSDTVGTLSMFYTNDVLDCSDTLTPLSVDLLPSFRISGNDNACVGGSNTYTAPTSPNGSYTWEALDAQGDVVAGPTSGVSTFNVTFSESGFYIIKATNTSGSYCEESEFLEVEVTALPDSPSVFIGDTSICPEGYYIYTTGVATGTNTFLWEIENGSPDTANGQQILVQWDQNGPWSIKIYEESANAPHCLSDPLEQIIHHRPNPKPTINGSDSVCENTSATYSSPNVADRFEWLISPSSAGSIVSGQLSNQIEVQWNGISTASTTASVILATKVCDSTNSDTITVYIDGINEPVISGDADGCTGDSIVFTETGNDPNAVSWVWSFGDGSTLTDSTDNVVKHPFTTYGSYSVEVSVSYTGLCAVVKKAAHLIDINPSPTAKLTSTAYPEICPPTGDTVNNQTLIVTQNNTFGTISYTYEWFKDGTLISGVTGTSYTPYLNGLGDYDVKITNNNTDCFTYTNVVDIDTCTQNGTNPGCVPDYSGTLDLTVTDLGCGLVQFTPSWSGTGYRFGLLEYGSGEGITTTDSTTHTYQYTKAGYHQVRLTIITPDNSPPGECSREVTKTAYVPLIPDFEIELRCEDDDYLFVLKDISNWVDSVPRDWTYYENGVLLSDTGWATLSYPGPGTHTYKMKVETGLDTCEITKTFTVDTAGKAGFSISDPSYCEKSPITFTDTSKGTIVSWDWIFDLDGSTDIQHPQFSFENLPLSTTPKTIKLITVDHHGCLDSISTTISVNDNELEGNVVANPIPVFCQGDSGLLTLVSLNGDPLNLDSISWFNGDTDTSTYVHNTGFYWAEVFDNSGCYEITPHTPVGVRPVPTARVFGLDEYCVGETAELNQYRGGSFTYAWIQNGVQVSTEPEYSYTSLVAQTDTFEAIIRDGICADTVIHYVTFLDPPSIDPITASPNRCVSSSPTLTVSATGSSSVLHYVWSNGDTGTTTTAETSGLFNVVVTDSLGCFSRADFTVADVPNFKNIMTGCYEFCEDDLNLFIHGVNPIVSHDWLGPNLSSLSTTTPYLINDTGHYELYLELDAGCVDTSDLIDITVTDCEECSSNNDPPALDSIWCKSKDANGNLTFGFSFSGTGFASSSALTVSSPALTVQNVSHTSVGSGSYTITGDIVDTSASDSVCLDIVFNSSPLAPGICEFTLCDTLPICYGPCEMPVTLDTLVCIRQVSGGVDVYYYEANIENFNNFTYTSGVSAESGVRPISGGNVVKGSNNFSGFWTTTSSSDTCLKFSLYDADSNRCCALTVCDPSPPTCTTSNCSFTGINTTIVCAGKDSLGNNIYAFEITVTNGTSNTYNIDLLSPGVQFFNVTPKTLANNSTDTIQGFFTDTSGITNLVANILAYDPVTGSRCKQNVVYFNVSSISCTNISSCHDGWDLIDIECKGYDIDGYPIYSVALEATDPYNPGFTGVWSTDGVISKLKPPTMGTSTDTIYFDIAVKDTTVDACIFFNMGSDIPLSTGCSQEYCITSFPDCCDEDSTGIGLRLRPERPEEQSFSLETDGTPSLKVIPNPARSMAEVRYAFGKEANNKIMVVDSYQHLVMEQTGLNGSGKIELQTRFWNAGLYFVMAIGSDGNAKVEKLIVIK